jgi:hypothetical protein
MSVATGSDASPSAIELRAQLSAIFESAQFRSSKRCQDLLSFLVEKTLEGRQDILKERVIGVEVFNRSTDYSPSSDPIVRVSVAEVRKRLAQYYQETPPGTRIPRIRVATGHYVPEFSWAESSPVEIQISERAPQRRPWLLWVAIPLLAVFLAGTWFLLRPASPLDAFWGPAFHSRRAALILSERYGPGSLMHRFNAEVGRPGAELPAGAKLLAGDIAATFGETVMAGNVFALRSMDRLFSTRGHEPEIRIGGQVSMADLAERPVVLIGYFNNPWAKNVNAEKPRFTLTNEHHDNVFRHVIHDARDPSRQWSIASDRPWFEATAVSYAIVTRIYDRHSNRFLVSIAGMTHLATSAAADFVSRPSYLEELQRQAPSGWERMNIQAVLQTNIVNDTATPPKLMATHFW